VFVAKYPKNPALLQRNRKVPFSSNSTASCSNPNRG
jgi:hypothetical protein